jgi:hypothetical protein
MNGTMQKSLDEQLGRMPRDIPPPRNLWPGIADRLRGRRHNSRPMIFAAAAALAGACLASALTWAVLHGRQVEPAPQLAAARPAPVAQDPTFDEPRNPRYVAARDSLEVNFRDRLKLLDPATRAKIEASLAVIRKAHDDIRTALAKDPASPVLEQLWQSTWHDEFDLYEHVVQATQPAMTRI